MIIINEHWVLIKDTFDNTYMLVSKNVHSSWSSDMDFTEFEFRPHPIAKEFFK
jgi:hypothetical protein